LVTTWRDLSNQLPGMYRDDWNQHKNPVYFVPEGVLLPNGMRLDYAGLRPSEDGDWHYGINGKYIKIYGGLMLENIIQALSRIDAREHHPSTKPHSSG